MADRARRLYAPPLRVDVTVRDGVRVPVALARLGRAIRAAALAAAAPTPASVGLVLTDDRELAQLNRTHMHTSGPTDVLSFPLLAPDSFGRGDHGAHPRRAAFPVPPGARTALGDIAISVERAVAQAREGTGGQDCRTRWDAADELLLLAVHGTLHLCGFDHAEPEEDKAMRILERRVLATS
jgi:probable rRNA maturation factor